PVAAAARLDHGTLRKPAEVSRAGAAADQGAHADAWTDLSRPRYRPGPAISRRILQARVRERRRSAGNVGGHADWRRARAAPAQDQAQRPALGGDEEAAVRNDPGDSA